MIKLLNKPWAPETPILFRHYILMIDQYEKATDFNAFTLYMATLNPFIEN